MDLEKENFEGAIIMKRQFSHAADLPVVYEINREDKTVRISVPFIDSGAILRFCTNYLYNFVNVNVVTDESGSRRIDPEYSLKIQTGGTVFNANVIKFMAIGSENEITLLINNVN